MIHPHAIVQAKGALRGQATARSASDRGLAVVVDADRKPVLDELCGSPSWQSSKQRDIAKREELKPRYAELIDF